MSEEDVQKMLQQAQMLEGYYAELVQREESMYGIIRDTAAAIEAVRALSGEAETETLLPVGQGTFVKAKISPADKLVLNVGAGVVLEKDSAYALNYLEARLKEIDAGLGDVSARRQQIGEQLEGTRQQMTRMIQPAQK